ncbi:universal stress protein [Mumia flava]|uniref:universal stress protein n=1 Tax=Mumia flava TaxID=1348852 RepID=UPI0012FDC477|nr:universal stress protein [Mumia flava]
MSTPSPTPAPHHARTPVRPVVVGIDGGPRDARVVAWAGVRAWAGRHPLRLVHAFRQTTSTDPFGTISWWDPAARDEAEQFVARVAAHVRARAPSVQVTTTTLAMGPVAALAWEGNGAEVVVIGRSRRAWFRPTGLSVEARLARRVPGRVVVVGPDDETLR